MFNFSTLKPLYFGQLVLNKPSIKYEYQQYKNILKNERTFFPQGNHDGRYHIEDLKKGAEDFSDVFNLLDSAGIDIKVSMPSPFNRQRTNLVDADTFVYQVDVKKKRARKNMLMTFEVPVKLGIQNLYTQVMGKVWSVVNFENSDIRLKK